ncbi:hypothetical protein C8F04DRAFT_1399509 [Mycena alexandri]|uniref:Uncharacterized protein n=1 Tax=Mycena alexandri TaxID=1745969 RepID=A0AAD6SKU6_9AGAR|nr:hypothetical protein C8F04DRAFT_1399509 [Mycena alexandri]
MLHHRSWAEFYAQSWGPVSVIFAGLTVTLEYLQVYLDLVFPSFAVFARMCQCVFVLYSSLNQSFNSWGFDRLVVIHLVFGGGATLHLFIMVAFGGMNVPPIWIAWIVIHWLLVLLDDICLKEIQRYRAEKRVLTWLESKLSHDSIPAGGRPALKAKLVNFWSGLWRSLRPGQGAILYNDVLDWLTLTGDPGTRKALWITVDHPKINTCVSDTIEFLAAVDKTISVDARSSPHSSSQPTGGNMEIDPRNSGGNYESQQPGEIPRVLVVIHSIRDLAQARELCDIIECLALKNQSLSIIAISTRELRKNFRVINSGNLPWFHKNLFILVLEGIFRSPEEVYKRLSIERPMWPQHVFLLYSSARNSVISRRSQYSVCYTK